MGRRKFYVLIDNLWVDVFNASHMKGRGGRNAYDIFELAFAIPFLDDSPEREVLYFYS